MNREVLLALRGWFKENGAYVLVDGQFGSTGKGVIAAAMAECFGEMVDVVTSNAGPNSGHTSYHRGEKIVLKQLPTFGVIAAREFNEEYAPEIYLNAGAVINKEVLDAEVRKYDVVPFVHPHAACVKPMEIAVDMDNVTNVASTGQGVGPAIISKLRRRPENVVGWGDVDACTVDLNDKVVFIEVSQGYSLGINSGFYPHCTTRECTVSQALSDAHLPPTAFRKSIMALRTFPIRVGSTENSSGGCYPDQHEINWSHIGVPPETTTVTGRIRRVFTWSNMQFKEAVKANRPDALFLNFMNYLPEEEREPFVLNMVQEYMKVMKRAPEAVLLGYGPTSDDIKAWEI